VPPLAPLYVGSYEVLSKHPKTFTLKVGDKSEVVSVDRLKWFQQLLWHVAGLLLVLGSSLRLREPQTGGGPVEMQTNVIFTIVSHV
jgi:hypothetical protein